MINVRYAAERVKSFMGPILWEASGLLLAIVAVPLACCISIGIFLALILLGLLAGVYLIAYRLMTLGRLLRLYATWSARRGSND